MSRPKPIILMEYVDPRTHRAEQILEAEAIYAVFYDGKPINLRMVEKLFDSNPKYRKVSYSNSGHAFNLSEKLNKMFKTNKFTVHQLVAGNIVTEDNG